MPLIKKVAARGARGGRGSKGERGSKGDRGTDFNPFSLDAQFATVHTILESHNLRLSERLDSQDEVLRQIKVKTDATEAQIVQNIARLLKHGETLSEIKIQTTATNGRVNKLEHSRKTQLAWAAGACSTVIVAVNIILYFLSHGILKF